LYQSEAFDLVITDIKMPEMDGLEMIKRMKLHSTDAEFIVLTGYGTVDYAVKR
jgi:YesN/AraC family two-component response regulator